MLDAQASSSSLRRVLSINPGSSGVVQLNGLNITGGYSNSVRALVQKFSKVIPHGKIVDVPASTLAHTTVTDPRHLQVVRAAEDL